MDLLNSLCWRFSLLILLMPRALYCLSLHIINEQPVHVISGSDLVLKARIQLGALEDFSIITWEREPETGPETSRETLATCTAQSCTATMPNVHASVDKQETTLQVSGYSRGDAGVYGATAVNRDGVNSTGHCIVREYEAVHHVSVSVNVSHSSLVCGEAWGTEPRFSWLYERQAITTKQGTVSKDGSMLFVTMSPMCGHFTCVVSNKLGSSSATYAAEPCDSGDQGTTAAVTCLLLLLLLLLLFGGGLFFRRWRRKRRNQGESLHEVLEDSM